MKKKRVYKILYGVMTAMLSLRTDGEEPNGEREAERLQPVGTADGDIAAPVLPAPVVSGVVSPEVVEESTGIEPVVAEEPETTEEAIEEAEGEAQPEEEVAEEPETVEEVIEEQELAEEPVAVEEVVEERPMEETETVEETEIAEEQPVDEPAESEEIAEEQGPVEETVEEVLEEPEITEEQSTEEVAEEEQPAEEPEVAEETEAVEEQEPIENQPVILSDSEESQGMIEELVQSAEEVQEEDETDAAEETQEEEEEIDTRFPTVDGLCFEWQEQTQTYTVTGVDEEQQRATQVIIPQRLFGYPVTEIGDSAFRGCRYLTEVVVPEGVTKIGDRAFYGCYALEKVELPDSLTSVGDEMFYLCMAITSQTEFDNAYYLGNKRNPYVLLSIHKSRDVDSCVIHQRTKFIDRGAFAECRSLTKIEIPNGVLGIGCKAFYRCVSLESVTLGSGLSHIGDSAFYGCSFLRSVEYTGAREAWGRIAIDANNEPLTKPVVRFRSTFSRPQ